VSRPAARAEVAWSGAAVVTVLLALGWLLLKDHRYFWYGDTPAAYYGWWYHLGELVRHGQWTTLDPHAWRAGNLAAEGQWGLWSPLTVGIGLLASVAGDMLLLTTVVKLALAVLAVLGVYLLVRSYDAAPSAAYVAAVLAPMGGMTQYLDLPSWAAAEMIWALFPWVWWGLRRTMLRGANPLPALVAGYLLVSVGYVFGTIMLVVAILACLVDCAVARDRVAALRVSAAGALLGLVAVTVYLPGVLTMSSTVRAAAYGTDPQKFTTDPMSLLTAILPTGAVPTPGAPLLPYTYLVWMLPALLWLDWRRVWRGWRPVAGLVAFTAMTTALVAGPDELGPLRYPLRLQPFLVLGSAVLVAVAWSGYRLARPSPLRLVLSLGWVALAVVRTSRTLPWQWHAQLWSALLVGGALLVLWSLLRIGRTGWSAPVVGVVTLTAVALQHSFFPTPASPQRNAPGDLAAYQGLYPGAVGDVLQVGASDGYAREDPAVARRLPVGSAWYLTGLSAQNTYTAISHEAYKERYCLFFQGNTCRALLRTLFSVEPTTGEQRVDLLGVSSLLLVREKFPAAVLDHPPTGWQVAESTPYSVLWTRRHPVPGAGHVVWTSAGTSVSSVRAEATGTTFRVDEVPAVGGTVVLSLLDWPGYSTSLGTLADPVDGYLVTVRVPASAQGRTVHVSFRPPGWTAEIAAWVLALVVGGVWSVGSVVVLRRSRRAR
jgi:hypothetical protein